MVCNLNINVMVATIYEHSINIGMHVFCVYTHYSVARNTSELIETTVVVEVVQVTFFNFAVT